jgi:squalene-hopene/tetraprenyl-beta-curcumene cyclase
MPETRRLEGLYFYYHVFARTLSVWDADKIEDASGVKHKWRKELVRALGQRQDADGRWVNAADRFMEGIPELTTAYAVLALQAAHRPAVIGRRDPQ